MQTNQKGECNMANYVMLLQWTDQGIRNFKDTPQRAKAAAETASKLGAKFVDSFWTLGPYDLTVIIEAPDDETITAVALKLASLGNVKTLTMRAFRAREMEAIIQKAA
jgi:uncharacterized protein with GYD domain